MRLDAPPPKGMQGQEGRLLRRHLHYHERAAVGGPRHRRQRLRLVHRRRELRRPLLVRAIRAGYDVGGVPFFQPLKCDFRTVQEHTGPISLPAPEVTCRGVSAVIVRT